MKKLISLSLSIVFVLSACMPSLGGGATTQEVPPQGEVDVVATSVALTMAADVEPAAPVVIEPTNTLPPPEPPTNTPVPELVATAAMNANCRSGPGANFDVIVFLKLGDNAAVIGQNQQAKLWYQLELPDGKLCWANAEALTITGDASGVPSVVSPPTPTAKPAPTWAGKWHLWFAYGMGTSTIQEPTVVFTQVGDQVTFSAVMGNLKFNYMGTSSADGMRLSGTFSVVNGTEGHTFYFVRDPSNLDQFGGQFHFMGGTTDGDFCGARPGEAKPDPCRR